MVRVSTAGAAAAVLVLSLCSLAALALLNVRMSRTDDPHFAFLTWNLFLAWIPFFVALALYAAHRAGASVVALVAGGIVWLVFLPNAPYLITDYIHLAPDSRVPLWFDFVLLGAFAASGLLLGFASVYLVQAMVSERAGWVAGWVVTGGVFALTAVGIYVGRVLRFNSWDVVDEPGVLAGLAMARLADPFGNPLLLATLVAFTGFLTVAYMCVYAVTIALVAGWRSVAQPVRRRA